MRGVTKITFETEDENAKPLTFSRDNTPDHHLAKTGMVARDAAAGYINGYAATLQALAYAVLVKADLRLVMLDVFERARTDQHFYSMLLALAQKAGIDYRSDKHRNEIQQYADTYYTLRQNPKSFHINIQQINSLAAYFAVHMRSNVRGGSRG